MNGLFITFEGGEATGKSTQIKLLSRWLKQKKIKVLVTREPGGTPLAEKLRRILKADAMNDMTELLLMEASRSEHVINKIIPALKNGFVVISDRYADSSLVYQGFCRGIPLKDVRYLNKLATRGLRPNRIFLLDGTIGMKRMYERRSLDRIEKAGEKFHLNVARAYKKLALKDKIFKILDASKSVDVIHQQILEIVLKDLKKNRIAKP